MTLQTTKKTTKQHPSPIRKRTPSRTGASPQKRGFKSHPVNATKTPKTNNAKKLRIIPLGGNEEVGKNMTIFEYGNDILILDMGLQFPEEDMHGIDYIIPNISYLKGKEKNVKAVIFSHGHLDHIGAAPILLERLGYPPIAGRPLTLAMIKHRQEDYKPNTTNRLKTLQIKSIKEKLSFGSFKVSFFQVDHSVMDAMGVIIETEGGTAIHPGDWTLEKKKNGQPELDYSPLAKLKNRPTILMLESLGAIDIRPSATQDQLHHNLEKIITEVKGRLIIGTFASQIERVGWIIQAAERFGKKVALSGYSMKTNFEIASKLGYIKAKKGTIVNANQINNYPDNKLVILATGAQGEGNAVLSRIISGTHRNLKLKKTDTVVLSSSIIPGNEATIQKLKDGLYRQCDNVIHGELMDIHVSGHGNRNDILHMVKTIKPDYFMPIYAFHYMLREAGKLAVDNKFKKENVFVLDNGQVAEFDKNSAEISKEKIDTSNILVDGLGIGDVGNIVLKDRQVMADDGMVVVVVQVNTRTRKVMNNPDIITRGFIHIKSSEKLMEAMRSKTKELTHKIVSKEMPKKNENWGHIRAKLRDNLSDYLFKETERRPMVLPVIIKV
jgi:ribonuclease J